jgi:hypothetical protein
VRAIVATMFMALAGFGTMAALPFRAGIAGQMVRVVVPLAVSAAVYLGAYRMLRGRELGMLISGVVGPEFRRASDGGGRDSSRGRRQDIDGRGGDPESERRSGRGG